MTPTNQQDEQNENKVLSVFRLFWNKDENCRSFSDIAGYAEISVKEVRLACRSLRKKGLVEFYNGLLTSDGEVAGSGYCINKAGVEYVKNNSL